ncbi:FCD domain-containing protein [Sinorhizobium meliloti]|uniref:FCD domain-containing protein n=1 Tax=Rhizobium meliloti TaxID=382 RepID=UPI003D0DA214
MGNRERSIQCALAGKPPDHAQTKGVHRLHGRTSATAVGAAPRGSTRLALEPAVLARWIPHLTPTEFERADDLITEMGAEEHPGRVGELNRRFHMTLWLS